MLQLLPRVVHHDDRRTVAGTQALDLDQREGSAGVGLARFDVKGVTNFFGDTLGTVHRAGQRPAHAQHERADRLLVEHRVIAHDVFHIRGSNPQCFRNRPHRVAGDVALLTLHQVQRGQYGRPALLGRIACQDLVELGTMLGREYEHGAVVAELPDRLVERGVIRHLGMKTHRSTSPMTTSIDPMTAITSAMSPPTIMCSRA